MQHRRTISYEHRSLYVAGRSECFHRKELVAKVRETLPEGIQKLLEGMQRGKGYMLRKLHKLYRYR